MKELDQVAGVISDRALATIGNFAVGMIKMRTAKGEDYSGGKFAPYSKKYKARRQAKGLPTGFVDLNWTGQMLGALTYESVNSPDSATVIVKFADAQQARKAHGHNYKIPAGKPRRFMGLSQQDVESIKQYILDGMKHGEGSPPPIS